MSSRLSDSRPLPPGSHPTASWLDRRLRNTSTIFYVVGIAIVFVVANYWELPAPTDRLALNVLASLGVVLAALQCYFPWHRFHRDLLLVNTLTVAGLVALLVAYSGGAQSPFASYYLFSATL